MTHPSMTTLLAWAPEVLEDCGRQWQAQGDRLQQLAGRLESAVAGTSPAWRGAAADAARKRLRCVHLGLQTLAGDLVAGGAVLRTSADELTAAQAELARGREIALAARLVVSDDGHVFAPPPVLSPAGAPVPWREPAVDAWRSAQALVRSALEAAADSDRRAARALALGQVGPLFAALAAMSAEPVVPAAGTDAYAVAAWWLRQTAEGRNALVAAAPEQLGALDGLPAVVRDVCNRRLLDDVETTARAGLLAVRAAANEGRAAAYAPAGEARRRGADTARLSAVLAACAAIRRTLADDAGRRRMLLVFDATGARAAVAVGNPDTADHVAVLVPGFSTTVATSIAGNSVAADSVVRSADDASSDGADRADGAETAAIAWLGYAAPLGLDVAGVGRAAAGAVALTALLRGLDAATAVGGARARAAHLTVIGHSYGSVVVGRAERAATGADDVVLLGSPGAGVGSAADVQVAAGHVYAAGAAGDVVADLGRFGPVPDAHDFGATALQTDGGVDLTGRTPRASHGHSDYYTDGSESLRNLGWIVSGHAEKATTVHAHR